MRERGPKARFPQTVVFDSNVSARALRDFDYTSKPASAGFEKIGIELTRVYDIEDARQFLAGQGIDVDTIAPQVAGKFMSAFIRAYKPAQNGAPRGA